MEYGTLRVIHVTGIAMTFIGLTGILALKMAGGAPLSKRMIFHVVFGIGMLAIIGTGFMLASKIGLVGAPPWIMGKFTIWLLAAASMVLANRFSRFAGPIVVFFILLVATAAYLAIYKP
ncbi:MAG TPA: hypothetical protein VHY09_15145 [Candidatus Methylacidiphilales bacterium]|jgi:hypothetical protein|nr:hypothetical protein [Candidatus Methylacidiphilales bacterium]